MEFILDQLTRRNVDITTNDMRAYILEVAQRHRQVYENIVQKRVNLVDIFYIMEVNNMGRAIAYLTLIYFMMDLCSEDEIITAIDLVAVPLQFLQPRRRG